MSGMQDTFKDGLATPTDDFLTNRGAPIPVPGGQKRQRVAASPRYGTDASSHSVSKSWSDNPASRSSKVTIAFSSAGHTRRPTFSQVISPRIEIPEKKLLVFDDIAEEKYVFMTGV
jgi:WD repeat-containing protein 59